MFVSKLIYNTFDAASSHISRLLLCHITQLEGLKLGGLWELAGSEALGRGAEAQSQCRLDQGPKGDVGTLHLQPL